MLYLLFVVVIKKKTYTTCIPFTTQPYTKYNSLSNMNLNVASSLIIVAAFFGILTRTTDAQRGRYSQTGTVGKGAGQTSGKGGRRYYDSYYSGARKNPYWGYTCVDSEFVVYKGKTCDWISNNLDPSKMKLKCNKTSELGNVYNLCPLTCSQVDLGPCEQ